MSGERIDSVYRVTFSDGSTCHYGNHATATAYARGGKVEEVSLTKPCPACESLARVVMLDQTYHEQAVPRRKWQSLSDDDIALIVADCAGSAHRRDDFSFARAIEAALRSKNA